MNDDVRINEGMYDNVHLKETRQHHVQNSNATVAVILTLRNLFSIATLQEILPWPARTLAQFGYQNNASGARAVT